MTRAAGWRLVQPICFKTERKIGDCAEGPLKKLNDWCFLCEGKPMGMFTVKILSDIQKQKP